VDPPDPLNWKLLGSMVLTVLFGVSAVSWASSAFIVYSKLPMVIGTLKAGNPPPLKVMSDPPVPPTWASRPLFTRILGLTLR
jgi:hypothetical protein